MKFAKLANSNGATPVSVSISVLSLFRRNFRQTLMAAPLYQKTWQGLMAPLWRADRLIGYPFTTRSLISYCLINQTKWSKQINQTQSQPSHYKVTMKSLWSNYRVIIKVTSKVTTKSLPSHDSWTTESEQQKHHPLRNQSENPDQESWNAANSKRMKLINSHSLLTKWPPPPNSVCALGKQAFQAASLFRHLFGPLFRPLFRPFELRNVFWIRASA